MKIDKEKWINQTFDSIQGMKKAEPNPFLFAKIISRIKTGNARTSYIPVKNIALVFISLILLLILNVSVLFFTDNGQPTAQNDAPSTELIPSQANPYFEILTK